VSREQTIGDNTRVRVPEAVLVRWLRGLADLLETGVPLLQALAVLGASGATRELSEDTAGYVERGHPFSFALLGRTPDVVPAMVRAGEASGKLPVALRNAARFLETRQQAFQMLRRELGMPLATAIYTSLVLAFAIGFVVPRFATVYDRMGITPPRLTKALLAVNQAVRDNWALLFVLALFVGVGIPIYIGRFEAIRRFHLGVFFWALGTLLESGVPIVQALKLAGVASGYPSIQKGAELAAEEIAEGSDLVDSFRRQDLLPNDLLVLFASGVTSGKLPESLESMSKLIQQQTQDAMGRAARWLGGSAVVVVGAAVLVLGISIYLPTIQLALSALRKVVAGGR
jgi:type II secretory pathway component PulF